MQARGTGTATTCGTGGADTNMGNGTFSLTNYWTAHHPGSPPTGASAYTSRLDLYAAETGCNLTTGTCSGTGSIAWNTGGTEPRAPHCLANRTSSLERRFIYVAVVNCNGLGITGNSSVGVTPTKYAQFFLTEPADSGVIYAEFVKLFTPADQNSKLKHIVELVR
jgi:hypothetical protein